MKLIIISTAILTAYCLLPTVLHAQPAFFFAKQMGGTANDDGMSIALDAGGNIYTTGGFGGGTGGTADFDPGAPVVNLTSAGVYDIFVSKLDASGNFVWAKRMGGTGNDVGFSIAVDAGGNIYITGYFEGTADFDPDAPVVNLTSASRDMFVTKLDASGSFVWARAMASTVFSDFSWGYSIAVDDASGNVYTTGFFDGTVDFDPGAPVVNLVSAGIRDVFLSKLNSSGNFVWAKQMGGTGIDESHNIVLDASENVYTIGYFENIVDFDPNGPIVNLTSAGGADVFVSKLDASGNFVWAKQIGGSNSDQGRGIALDDASGNIYITGYFYGTADFDPGAGIYNMTPLGAYDAFVSKLNNLGDFVWAKQMGGIGAAVGVLGIFIDASVNIYTTGFFYETADFDPGAGSYNLIGQATNPDIFISKLDASGNFVCAGRMGGTGFDWGYSIAVDPSGNMYAFGKFFATADFDPGAGVYSLTSAGNYDIVVGKYICASILSTTATSTNILCNGQCTGTASAAAAGGSPSYTYLWNNGQPTQTATGLCAGTYTVTVTDVTGGTATASVTITQPPAIIVNAGSNVTITVGNSTTLTASGGGTYSWNTGGIPLS